MKTENLLHSIKCAAKGVAVAVKNERNMRIHLTFALVVLLLAGFFSVTRTELLILILTMVIVIAAEMFNTALEYTVDLCTEEYHPLAEKVKNVASGAVLLTALGAIITGIIIFGPRLWQSIN